MNTKKTVLKNAQKLGRDQQKVISGGIQGHPSICCGWNNSQCIQWVLNLLNCSN